MNLGSGRIRVPEKFLHGTKFTTSVFHLTCILQGVSRFSTITFYRSNRGKSPQQWGYMSSFYSSVICQGVTHLSSGDNTYGISYFHRCGSNKLYQRATRLTWDPSQLGSMLEELLAQCDSPCSPLQPSLCTCAVCQRHILTWSPWLWSRRVGNKSNMFLFT